MVAAIVLAVNFLNFTYSHNPCSGNVPVPVVMRAGSFSWQSPRDPSWGFEFYVQRVVEGSLAPGTRQAVVVIGCDAPVDGGAAEAYLYDERSGSATFVRTVAEAQWGIDWGVPPSSIHIRFSDNLLYVDQCQNDSDCSNNDYVVSTYAMRNGKIEEIYKKAHKLRT